MIILFQHPSAKTILFFKPDGNSLSWFPGVWNVVVLAAFKQPWYVWLQAWELFTTMQDRALDVIKRSSRVTRESPCSFPELSNSSLSGGFPSQLSERERPMLPCTWWMGGLFTHVCHLRRWATWSPADKRMFLIAVLLGEGIHMECGHPFSVRDDQGICGNLLQRVEPLGREKQPHWSCFTAFPLNWQSRS